MRISNSAKSFFVAGLFSVLANAQMDEGFRPPQTEQQAPFLDIADVRVSQYKALQVCNKLEAHLPSARELAQFAMSLGAKGVVEQCGSDSQCHLILATNADGTADRFYYSESGYHRPHNDLGYWLWSSSLYSNGSDSAIFLAPDGHIGAYARYREDIFAARCATGRFQAVLTPVPAHSNGQNTCTNCVSRDCRVEKPRANGGARILIDGVQVYHSIFANCSDLEMVLKRFVIEHNVTCSSLEDSCKDN